VQFKVFAPSPSQQVEVQQDDDNKNIDSVLDALSDLIIDSFLLTRKKHIKTSENKKLETKYL